jgi:hypothetical protein
LQDEGSKPNFSDMAKACGRAWYHFIDCRLELCCGQSMATHWKLAYLAANHRLSNRRSSVAGTTAAFADMDGNRQIPGAETINQAVCQLFMFQSTVARVTGLEPATSGVTGRRSNQLSYTR